MREDAAATARRIVEEVLALHASPSHDEAPEASASPEASEDRAGVPAPGAEPRASRPAPAEPEEPSEAARVARRIVEEVLAGLEAAEVDVHDLPAGGASAADERTERIDPDEPSTTQEPSTATARMQQILDEEAVPGEAGDAAGAPEVAGSAPASGRDADHGGHRDEADAVERRGGSGGGTDEPAPERADEPAPEGADEPVPGSAEDIVRRIVADVQAESTRSAPPTDDTADDTVQLPEGGDDTVQLPEGGDDTVPPSETRSAADEEHRTTAGPPDPGHGGEPDDATGQRRARPGEGERPEAGTGTRVLAGTGSADTGPTPQPAAGGPTVAVADDGRGEPVTPQGGALVGWAAPPEPDAAPVSAGEEAPQRTLRWLVASLLGAVALAVLFPLAVAALRALVSVG